VHSRAANPLNATKGRVEACADYIKIDLGDGRKVRASGPFSEQAQAPANQWAFYINDFSLNKAKPWFVPEQIAIASLPTSTSEVRAFPPLSWQQPDRDLFEAQFQDILERLKSDQICKVVPAVIESAEWDLRDAELLIARSFTAAGSDASHGYAFNLGQQGAVGRTPEMLFRLENGVLQTMALAGTVPVGREDELWADPKLQHEHETVVEVLRERLAPLGAVKVEPRCLLPLQNMTHLCTRVSVVLQADDWLERADELIHLLHPTPALGVTPSTDENRAQLMDYRRQMNVPAHFGAPIGVKWPGGMLLIVAIRGLFWEGTRLSLPSGCGVVTGSDFASEWSELDLKRQWIHRAFGC
jgi:isochorismate synthase EntC